MNDVEEQILSYPHLSVEAQREVEAYVESNPEWAPLLRDVRTIEGLPAPAQADLPSDALLATYVTVQHLHPEDVPTRLKSAFSRLEARLEEEETLRREAAAARQRLEEAEAAVDPVSRFEQLSGHTMKSEAESETTKRTEPASEGRHSTPSLLEVFLNLPVLVRRGAAVAVVLVAVYGGLYGISRVTQSPLERLAAVDISSQVVENYANADLRSPVAEADTPSVDDQYLDALSALRKARVSTLGLFPRYNADTLNEAEQGLEEVLEQVEPESFLALEAHFYLGKIALAQEEMNVARRHFKTVVNGEGRQTDEAYEILKSLQQEYGATTE